MKITNINFFCDVCGEEMNHQAFLECPEVGGYAYSIVIKRRDLSKKKGTYRPPFKLCHICDKCIKAIAGLMEKK